MTRISAVLLSCVAVAAGAACVGPSDTGAVAESRSDAERVRQALQSRLATAGGALVVEGLDGWLFFVPELRHVVAGKFWDDDASAAAPSAGPPDADPLPAILDFKRQLDDLGVGLLMVPVPAKALVYPDRLGLDVAVGARFDEQDEAFIEVLRGQNIDVLDLAPVFLDHRDHPEGPLYCLQDTHWSGPGTVVAAERIATVAEAAPWYGDTPRIAVETAWRAVEITGDLWRLLDREDVAREQIRLRFVGTRTTTGLAPVAPMDDSPVVLLGDSHGLVFHAGDDMHARGAGLADQLAYELGFPVDLIAVRGSGATPARFNLLRKARRVEGYWARKRLVVWVFSVREFTQSDGWRRVPVL